MVLSTKLKWETFMQKFVLAIAPFVLLAACADQSKPVSNGPLKPLPSQASCPSGDQGYSLAIHGGAGVILKKNMSDELEAEYRTTLTEALTLGKSQLEKGMTALDAIEHVVIFLEDDPKFNAGKGAVFNAEGENELDASIMDGSDRNAGSVAGVKNIKNPIRAARAVMENSRHVMLQGKGAEIFAREQALEFVDGDYFFTQRRYDQMQKKLEQQQGSYDPFSGEPQTRFGTVGVVVKDNCGNLGAGTSTGGLTAKKWGRVGDTPIIGAGTYADNRYCAVSSTGTGEFFIRATIARDICARREFLGEPLQTAADHVIHKTLADMGGDGGIVAIDENGQHVFSFNTPGMYRGAVNSSELIVEIYGIKR